MGGGTKKDLTGAKGAISGEGKAPIGPDGVHLIPPEDDSETIPRTTRKALMVGLADAVNDERLVGDLVLAHRAIALLLHILSDQHRR